MIFDNTDEPLTEHEMIASARYLRLVLNFWRGSRTLFFGLALIMSCSSVIPFLAGHALHRYWNSIGKYLVIFSMLLLLPVNFCAVHWYYCWKGRRGQSS